MGYRLGRVAVQMDPIDHIQFDTDTSLILMIEAQARGAQIFIYEPKDMMYDGHSVKAWVTPVVCRYVREKYVTKSSRKLIDLSTMDVILLRQDPPFDMRYITTTYMLEALMPKVFVANHPKTVRDHPEKLFTFACKDFTPPTIITEDLEHIEAFRKEIGDCVVKPLYAYGGRHIFQLLANDPNAQSIVETLVNIYHCPMVVQRFIPGITKGDKRILLIDGEAVGALNRIPKQGSIRSNLASGGTPYVTTLSVRELEICEHLKPILKQHQILLAGIDVIDGLLTEINITSPTGMQVINRFNNSKLETIFWDRLEGYL